MIVCKDCGATLPNNAKFCKECGLEIPDNIKFCNNCHADVPEDAKFCTECGNHIEQKKSNAFNILLIVIILAGSALVVYRSIDLPQETNIFQKQEALLTKKDVKKYEEVSLQHMIFLGERTNTIQLNIFSPTTQSLILDYSNEWLETNLEDGIIRNKDINKIEIYEKNLETKQETKRADLIRINLDLNPDYQFPKGTFSNIGNHLYINWINKENE